MTTFLLFVIVVWFAVGLALALVMGRRGYSPWNCGVIGAVLGRGADQPRGRSHE
jgi:hypothetical protein